MAGKRVSVERCHVVRQKLLAVSVKRQFDSLNQGTLECFVSQRMKIPFANFTSGNIEHDSRDKKKKILNEYQ